jgi:hypothetical protein
MLQCPDYRNSPLWLALVIQCLTKGVLKFQHKCNTKLTLKLDLTQCHDRVHLGLHVFHMDVWVNFSSDPVANFWGYR